MKERTLLNIKPDAVSKNLVGKIIQRIEDRDFRIVAIDKLTLVRGEAEAIYEIHRDRSFYQGLVEFMCSGPCVPMVVEGDNVVQGVRDIVGATDPLNAEEGTIRRDFAENVQRNAVHASDAPETASQEIAFFFSRRQLL